MHDAMKAYHESWERELDRQFLKNDRYRKRAYICSPLSGSTAEEELSNIWRARAYMLYARTMLGYGSRIAANAKLIRHGNLSLEYGEDFQFYDSCDMSTSAQQIETLYLQETAKYGVDNVALLTPYRQKTETGVNALNERLREKLNPQDGEKPEVVYRKRIYRLRDKVMQIKNCEDISNGDIGYITSITRDDTDSVLTVDFGDGRIAEYDGSDLEMLDLAYASTIHKSQGSEYKSVIINLQCAHAVMLVRPLVYTAITRAKERVLIVGERRALCIAIKRTDTEQRGTMLSARIKELISNVKGDHYNGNLAQ